MLTWILNNYMTVLTVAGTVCLGASVAVGAIAKLTRNTTDDKVSGWLKTVYNFLHRLSLNTDRPAQLSSAKPASLVGSK